MAPAKILVVDHDPAIRNLISRFLTRQNYQVESAEDWKIAVTIFEQFNPDLVILDVDLPDANGYDLCQDLQSRTDVFVLMLTSRTDDADKIHALAQRADDYLTKPFSLGELGVRVGALLRRQRIREKQKCLILESPNGEKLTIDPVRREVRRNDEIVPLTALEFDLLYFLANNPDRQWKGAELIQGVWDCEYVGDRRVVDVHLDQIRKKIGKNFGI